MLRAENVAAGSGKLITEGIGSVVSLFKGDMDGVSNKMNNITSMIQTGFVDNVTAGAKGFMKAGTDMGILISNLGKKYGVINEQTNGSKGTTQSGQDVEISANGQKISLLPEDTLFAGTNPQSLAARMMEIMNTKKETTPSMPVSSTLDVNHKVSFDNLPPHINESNLVAHMEKVMNNLSFQESLSKSQKDFLSYNNLV